MMVGRPVQLVSRQDAGRARRGRSWRWRTCACPSHAAQAQRRRTTCRFHVRAGEIVCIAGIDGNGQTELIHGLTGLEKITGGTVTLCGKDITHASIREPRQGRHEPHPRGPAQARPGARLHAGAEHGAPALLGAAVPARRLHPPRRRARTTPTGSSSSSTSAAARAPSRSRAACPAATSRRPSSPARSTATSRCIVAVQPTRGLDVGAIEYIHKQLVAQRDAGKAVLLVSLELDEVMSLSDRILVMYEGRDRRRA